MTENEVAKIIVDACYKIHKTLGPGLMESVYEAILQRELQTRGLHVARQVPVMIKWEGFVFEEAFRADLLVEDVVVFELKSVEKLAPVHAKQLITYVRLLDRRLGLLINFGEEMMRSGIRRIVNGLDDTPPTSPT